MSPAYCVHRRSYARALREGKGVTEHSPKDPKAIAEIQALWAHLNTLNPVTKPKKVKA